MLRIGDAWLSDTRRAQLRFALWFASIAAVLMGLYAFPYAELGVSERFFQSYLSAYAGLVGRVLGLFETGVHVDGTLITGRYALRVIKTCDAMEANLLFTAAVLATSGPWLRKLEALFLGLVALCLANVLRICSLYYVGAFAPGVFELLHEEIWPLVLVLFACGCFLFAGSFIRRDSLPLPPATA